MRSRPLPSLAIAALTALAALLSAERPLLAAEVVIEGSPNERGAPTQFQKSATCVNKASCAVSFPVVPQKRRFEVKYLNCRFDGPYQVFQANLSSDAAPPLMVDLAPLRIFDYLSTVYATFATPVELLVTAGRHASVTVQMIGQGGTIHLRCLLVGNWIVLP